MSEHEGIMMTTFFWICLLLLTIEKREERTYGHRGREIDAGELDVEHEGVALDLERLVLDQDMLDLKDVLALDDTGTMVGRGMRRL